jgi:membrane-bound serine protease (ClpP class)
MRGKITVILPILLLWSLFSSWNGNFQLLTSNIQLPVAVAAEQTVYMVPLDGPVEKGLARFLDRAFREAAGDGAAAVILELNTPGGLLDAALEINDLIADSPVPVYAYVRYRAYSAGAYLALACRKLFMAPGSVIGAAEPRSLLGGGEVADEKTLSAWEAAMRAVAERQGKNPQVAAAMVRKEIVIEGLDGDTELLTLTASEAGEINFADGTPGTRAELLELLGLPGARVVTVGQRPAEQVARFLTDPLVATLLLTVGIAALAMEVMTAGLGVAGAISLAAFVLFFGGHVLAGLAGWEVIFLFVVGVILLLIEAFFPNFGVLGLAGAGAIVASVVLSAATAGEGLRLLASSLVLSALVIAVSFRYLKRSGLWSQIVLQFAETKEQGYVGPGDSSYLVGREGVTLTPLRPAGVAELEGRRVDVVSEGGFVAAGTPVRVVAVEGSRVVVRAVQ